MTPKMADNSGSFKIIFLQRIFSDSMITNGRFAPGRPRDRGILGRGSICGLFLKPGSRIKSGMTS